MGGLAHDAGLLAALQESREKHELSLEPRTHPDAVYAGAVGAADLGAFRVDKLAADGLLGKALQGSA